MCVYSRITPFVVEQTSRVQVRPILHPLVGTVFYTLRIVSVSTLFNILTIKCFITFRFFHLFKYLLQGEPALKTWSLVLFLPLVFNNFFTRASPSLGLQLVIERDYYRLKQIFLDYERPLDLGHPFYQSSVSI